MREWLVIGVGPSEYWLVIEGVGYVKGRGECVWGMRNFHCNFDL